MVRIASTYVDVMRRTRTIAGKTPVSVFAKPVGEVKVVTRSAKVCGAKVARTNVVVKTVEYATTPTGSARVSKVTTEPCVNTSVFKGIMDPSAARTRVVCKVITGLIAPSDVIATWRRRTLVMLPLERACVLQVIKVHIAQNPATDTTGG